jgi:hypothetical protein
MPLITNGGSGTLIILSYINFVVLKVLYVIIGAYSLSVGLSTPAPYSPPRFISVPAHRPYMEKRGLCPLLNTPLD